MSGGLLRLLRMLLLVPLLLPVSVSWGAGTSTEVGTVIDGQGVELAVLVPRTNYPRNALVQATIEVTNRSDITISYGTGCPGGDPAVFVYRYDRTTPSRPDQVFPAILQPILFSSPCLPGPPHGLTLEPGRSVLQAQYIILAGRYVEGRATVGGPATASALATPLFTVGLSHAAPPRITMHTSPTVYAVIHPAKGEHPTTSALYVQAYQCRAAPGGRQQEWTELGGDRLAPPCPDPVSWYAIVGWPNHSVGVIQYPERRPGSG